MGRSKFPGKPSKSINRKRISVLQLENEAATTDPEEGLSAAAATNTSNKKNCDKDDDDENEKGGSGSGNAARGESSANPPSNRSVNGGGNSGGNNNSDGTGKLGSSGGMKLAKHEDSSSKAVGTVTRSTTIKDIDLASENVSNGVNNNIEEENDEDDDNVSLASGNSLQSLSSVCSTSTTFSNSSGDGSGGGKGQKKFKNLNLAKAEVMLPSSSKLKQQLNYPSPTVLTVNNPTGTETKVAAGEIIAAPGNCDAVLKTELPQTNISNDEQHISDSNHSHDELNTTAAVVVPTLSNTDTAPTVELHSAATNVSILKHKKIVTFKNILETSDDKSAVKKFYNPDNRVPLVSIMKKESLNRAMAYSRSGECIVRPSRLTEILKNHSNIDKLNALKFRSTVSTNETSSVATFGAGLSRAFGAPLCTVDDKNHKTVAFRLQHRESRNYDKKGDNEAVRENAADDADENDDDDDDDDEDDDDDDDEDDDAEGVNVVQIEARNESHRAAPEENVPSTVAKEESNEDDEDGPQMIVDKHFVLPKRSTRSSRVIKPNKRLLEDGIICKRANNIKLKHINVKSAQRIEQPNLFGLRDFVISPDEYMSTLSLAIKTTKDSTESNKSGFARSSAFANFGGVKASSFVLRQPRLQFDSLSERHNPTSLSNSSLRSSSFGSVATAANLLAGDGTACGVCSSHINSKDEQQARKYGTLACGPCRKFISKISKKSIATSSSPAFKQIQLQCKADSNCNMSCHTKGHSKNFKKVYKERCAACWLQKCIKTFQLPAGHKLRLCSVLPALAQSKQINELKSQNNALEDSKNILMQESEQHSPNGLFTNACLIASPTTTTTTITTLSKILNGNQH